METSSPLSSPPSSISSSRPSISPPRRIPSETPTKKEPGEITKRRQGREREIPCIYCTRRIARDPRHKCHDALVGQYGAESYAGMRCCECIGSHATCHLIPPHTTDVVQALVDAAKATVDHEDQHGKLDASLHATYESALTRALAALDGHGIQPSQKLLELRKAQRHLDKQAADAAITPRKRRPLPPGRRIKKKASSRKQYSARSASVTVRERPPRRNGGRREDEDGSEESLLLTGQAAERVLDELLGADGEVEDEEREDDGWGLEGRGGVDVSYLQFPVGGGSSVPVEEVRGEEDEMYYRMSGGHGNGLGRGARSPSFRRENLDPALEHHQREHEENHEHLYRYEQHQRQHQHHPQSPSPTPHRSQPPSESTNRQRRSVLEAVAHVRERDDDDESRVERLELQALRRRKVAALEALAHSNSLLVDTNALLLAEMQALNRRARVEARERRG